ncbi:hypothetical protein BDF19DRAFT_421307 [Syncephalis fuscata]|nr:hypothetical protein BDF19DRAFT_421307 [Syncephalis fuscata]
MEHLQNTTSAGRRFHGDKNAPYPLPNDSSEINRLNTQHPVFKKLLNGNYMSKLNNPKRILDVGSGTGIWAVEMAEEFPQSEINCIDISPELSTTKLPSNVKFETMNACNTENYWINYQGSGTPCSPGGSIEFFETDSLLKNAGPLGQEVNSWFNTLCRSRGSNVSKFWEIPQMMQEAGLQMEVEHFIEIPIGEWCDQVGRHGWTDYYNLISPLCTKIMSTCNVTKERFDYVLANLHEENVAHRVYRKWVYLSAANHKE